MTADIRDQFISRATRKGYNPAEAAERLDTLLASDPSADRLAYELQHWDYATERTARRYAGLTY